MDIKGGRAGRPLPASIAWRRQLKLELKLLGHVVSADGIHTDPDKVRAIRDMAPPADVKGVRAFLGMTGYYRQFIPTYAKVARRVTQAKRHAAELEQSAMADERRLRYAVRVDPDLPVATFKIMRRNWNSPRWQTHSHCFTPLRPKFNPRTGQRPYV